MKLGQDFRLILNSSSIMDFVWIEPMQCFVGMYPVTNSEYRTLAPTSSGECFDSDRQPVVCVNFDDAKAYAEWLTEQNKAQLPKGYVFRLPTEAEWETFAKCGDNREYPWGNEWPPKYGHYRGTATCNVEESGRNEWGLYGVGGNVWECCTDDRGAFGAWRGASWFYYDQYLLRVGYRVSLDAALRVDNYGFRLVAAPVLGSAIDK